MINLTTKPEDAKLITAIAERAVDLLQVDLIDTEMDLACVHLNDTELRLNDLLNSDDFNFTHDIYGIKNCLNRRTGKLENCFLPRFSK